MATLCLAIYSPPFWSGLHGVRIAHARSMAHGGDLPPAGRSESSPRALAPLLSPEPVSSRPVPLPCSSLVCALCRAAPRSAERSSSPGRPSPSTCTSQRLAGQHCWRRQEHTTASEGRLAAAVLWSKTQEARHLPPHRPAAGLFVGQFRSQALRERQTPARSSVPAGPGRGRHRSIVAASASR
jgi:hypothetical protein